MNCFPLANMLASSKPLQRHWPLQRRWENWEINLLLDSVATNQHVSISLPGREQTLQSVIIGFDLTNSTLLLDTLFPYSEREVNNLRAENIPLVVAIPSSVAGEKFYYNLTARIVDICPTHDGFLTEVSIQGVDVSSRRRRDSRVHFDKSARPPVELVVGDDPAVRGRLCNLSRYGCLVEFFGDDATRKMQNRKISLNMHFNSQFDVTVPGFVVQARFGKRPSYHNRLHIQFCQVDDEAQDQINGFITSVVHRELRESRFQVA